MCSAEELSEIYDGDKNKVIDTAEGEMNYDQAWKRLTKRCYVDKCDARGTDTCVQRWNERNCVCKDGFEDETCSKDIDECSWTGELKVCNGSHMKCENNIGSYSCGCESGFIRDEESCVPARTCADNPCGLNTVCTDDDDVGFVCNCFSGFAMDINGFNCDVDIDECADNGACLDKPFSTCQNEIGSFSCMCNEGYEEVDGKCIEIPKCRGVICDMNGYCDPLDGVCYCNAGFKGGDICVDIDECSEGVFGITGDGDSACPGQVCQNTIGSYDCSDVPTPESAVTEPETTTEEVTTEATEPAPEATTEPEITEPAQEPTTIFVPPSSNRCSVDVDECQVNNGDCPGMCMNYFCHRKCYEEISEEAKMCHHYSTREVPTESNDMRDYACHCFAGHKLCVDQFSCIPETSNIEFDTHSNCASGQIGIDSSCYSISSEKASFDAASESCSSQGGSLANVNSRKAWFILGSNVNNGHSSFWVGNGSDADMYVFGNGSGRLANPAQDMNNVPPQMDNVDGSEEHIYVCEF